MATESLEVKTSSGTGEISSETSDETSGHVDSDYASFWNEFKLRTDEKEKTVEFLRGLESVKFGEITSMISVGAGEADVDFEVIKSSCPKLVKYIAIEPRAESVEIIREKFSKLPQVQVETVQKTIQEYSGPAQPVDLVFMCNSSYYFRDSYHEEMSRALSWLTPGGSLVDIRDNIEDIPYRQTLKSMGSKPGRSMKDAQKTFLNWCVENGWEIDGSVDEKEYNIDYSIDISEPGLDQVLKLLVQTLPEEQMGQAKEVISSSVIKGTTRVPGKQLVIIISRATEGRGDQAVDAEMTEQQKGTSERTGKQAKDADAERSGDQRENATDSEESVSKVARLSAGEELENT